MQFTRYLTVTSKSVLGLFIVMAIVTTAAYIYISEKDMPKQQKNIKTSTSEPKPKSKLNLIKQAEAKSINVFHADIFDYTNVKNTAEKKQIFFDTLRPIIISQNQQIKDQRQQILFAKESNTIQPWLETIAEKYNVDWNNEQPDWDQLLQHIDTIPQELVMAQAANESAWGKSTFAQKGNNLFGQWCFKKGCGIVPGQRNSGANHEVRKFASINDSVASYMHNLNTGHAYKDLRKLRASLRTANKTIDGHTLAKGLEKYSSRGAEYVKEIQSMIRTNKTIMLSNKKV